MLMEHYNRGRPICEKVLQRNADKLEISFHTTEMFLPTIWLYRLIPKLYLYICKTSLTSPASYSGKFNCLYSKWMITQCAAPY